MCIFKDVKTHVDALPSRSSTSPPADVPFVAFSHYKHSTSPDLLPKRSPSPPSLLQFWPPPSRGAIRTPKDECSSLPPFLPTTSLRITTPITSARYYESAGPPCDPADFISLSLSAFLQGNSAMQHMSSPDTVSPLPTWAPPSLPTRIGSALPVSADTLAGRPLTSSSTAPSGTSGRQDLPSHQPLVDSNFAVFCSRVFQPSRALAARCAARSRSLALTTLSRSRPSRVPLTEQYLSSAI
ncbi:hypothetical protein BOTBODRAFT_182034 [Botryobasidium botryosum FD-172 SS1]|uniref:Uncharacterized protein n=1 Tax=Botryobasidium botryosum (strain FD-172 SS1) TaxID=930990 RepID=A0A067LUN9_BOTB1|nr:hypothetical protein BOTBODRAFT_182034 [Botryobasidium botryosum FD-172 SS1]